MNGTGDLTTITESPVFCGFDVVGADADNIYFAKKKCPPDQVEIPLTIERYSESYKKSRCEMISEVKKAVDYIHHREGILKGMKFMKLNLNSATPTQKSITDSQNDFFQTKALEEENKRGFKIKCTVTANRCQIYQLHFNKWIRERRKIYEHLRTPWRCIFATDPVKTELSEPPYFELIGVDLVFLTQRGIIQYGLLAALVGAVFFTSGYSCWRSWPSISGDNTKEERENHDVVEES